MAPVQIAAIVAAPPPRCVNTSIQVPSAALARPYSAWSRRMSTARWHGRLALAGKLTSTQPRRAQAIYMIDTRPEPRRRAVNGALHPHAAPCEPIPGTTKHGWPGARRHKPPTAPTAQVQNGDDGSSTGFACVAAAGAPWRHWHLEDCLNVKERVLACLH